MTVTIVSKHEIHSGADTHRDICREDRTTESPCWDSAKPTIHCFFPNSQSGAEADIFFVGGMSKISWWIRSIFDQNNGGILNLLKDLHGILKNCWGQMPPSHTMWLRHCSQFRFTPLSANTITSEKLGHSRNSWLNYLFSSSSD